MEEKFSLVQSKDLTHNSFVKVPSNFENSSGKKPLGPPAATKKVIVEELARLKASISGSQTLDTYMYLEEKYLELKDFRESIQPEDPYQQSYPDFIKTKVFEIPDSLLEKYVRASECSVLSGILAEIQRVWYSFDNVLYFWDYSQGNSLLEYPVSEDVVVSVSVVPKNNDLFTNKVLCMLLIATKNQISFVGVSLDPDLKLIESGLKATTDEVPIQCISVLKNGRILMGGADGSISELKYASNSWFSTTKRYKRTDISSSFFSVLLPKFIKDYNSFKVAEISVDSSRNILYCLINNDSGKYRIEVYDLGVLNNLNKKVCKITSAQLTQRLREYSQRMCNLNPDRLEVVHIEALSRQVTTEFHMMGITRNGIRILFTFYEQPSEISLDDPVLSLRPVPEYSIYIKFPPAAVKLETKLDINNYSLGITSDKPSSYEKCVMLESGNLLVLEHGERISRVLCMGRSLSRIALFQTERHRAVVEPEETVSCIEEIRDVDVQHITEVKAFYKMTMNVSRLCNYAARSEYREKGPVRYLGSAPGSLSFECLTNLSNINYRPSSDLLILTSRQLIQYSEIRPIDLLYQALVSDSDPAKITEFVVKFGVLHTCALLLGLIVGPTHINTNEEAILTPLPESQCARATQLFKDIGNHKIMDSNVYSYKPEDPLMCLSEYKALYLYTSRILRPVWEEHISYCVDEPRNQIEEFQGSQLREIKQRLEKFRAFVLHNYAENAKKNSNCVFNLVEFVKRNEDCLELLSLITEDYCFRRVVNELVPDDQVLLKNITYHELVSSSQGHSLAKALIEAYILQLRNPRLSRQRRPSLEETLKNLNAKCSSFFTLVDSEIYIAQECLYKAISCENPQQKNDLIDEAMKRLLRNAASVGLGRVCNDLKELAFYRGIVCVCIQKAIDINDIKGDEGGSEIEECYGYLTQILNDLKDCLSGLITCSYWFSRIPITSILEIKQDIVNEFVRFQDKNVHRILFTWLVECGLSNEILMIDSPFTKSFIEESTKKGQINETCLLAKYCMKMKDYLNAYKEFDRLASLKKKETRFEERLEYLDLCSHCLDKHFETIDPNSPDKHLFEQERENHFAKKKLARVQANLRQALISKQEFNAAQEIETELMSVNELFDKYAKTYELYMNQFEILDYIHCYTQGEKKDIEKIMKSTFIPLIKTCCNMHWPAVICEKLVEIGEKYPYCFDLEYIINKVEFINSQKNTETNWLVALLVSLPIDQGYSEIWSIYYENWKNSFINPDFLYILSLRCEAVLRAWFNELNKKLVETIVWNKNTKEKASPYKFIEKSQEINSFFNQSKSLKDYLTMDRWIKISSFLTTQENVFNNLKNELISNETSVQVLKKKITFEGLDASSMSGSEGQKKKEIMIRRPLNFNKNNI